jgi:hypothetical protein
VVFPGAETTLVNVFADDALGVIDIYVRSDEEPTNDDPLGSALEGAEVCIAPVGEEGLAEFNCVYTDLSGYANFLFVFSDLSFGEAAFVSSGTYVVTVSRYGYEQESSTFEYNVAEDAADGNLYDLFLLDLLGVSGSPDVEVALDPGADIGILNVNANLVDATGDTPEEAILGYILGIAIGNVVIYEAAPGDSDAGCTGTPVLEVPSNLLFLGALLDLLEINIDLPAGDYCAGGYAELDLEPTFGIEFSVTTTGYTPDGQLPLVVTAGNTTQVDMILEGDFPDAP